ncbi:MAG TPA: glycosyltransferase family 39 protein [Candidatus Sumerlaeota bacterium]|nr:glycosyltransferase family 39 protein [Candidatus Sumerlaeota bacterium]
MRPALAGAGSPTPRQPALALAGLLALAWAVRWLLACCVPSPVILTDELQYIEMARHFPARGGLLWNGVQAWYPCWAYFVLIAPLARLPMPAALLAIRAINAALGSLGGLLAYGLAREFLTGRRALAAAALTLLLPAGAYTASVMTESLWVPVFVGAAWLGARAIAQPTRRRCLAAGAVAGLAFHVKPQGILIPAILALTAVIHEIRRLPSIAAESPDRDGRQWRAWIRALAPHGVTALGWTLVAGLRVLEVVFVERPAHPFTPAAWLANYGRVADGLYPLVPWQWPLSAAGYVLGWLLALGVLPAWLALRHPPPAAEPARGGDLGRILRVYTLVGAALFIVVIARHTLVNDEGWRFHERYLVGLEPLVLILFCGALGPAADGRRWAAMFRIDLLFAVWLVCLFAGGRMAFTLPVDAPALTAVAALHQLRLLPVWAAVVIVLLFLGAPALVIFSSPRPAARLGALGLLFAAMNFGYYASAHYITRWATEEERELAIGLERFVEPGDTLTILLDGLRPLQVHHAAFRRPAAVVFLSQSVREQANGWWARPMGLEQDRFRPAAGAGRHWLLAGAAWRIHGARPVQLGTARLYPVPRDGLRFDPAQLADHLGGAAPVLPPRKVYPSPHS